MSDRVTVAKALGAFGIQGDVKVLSFTAVPADAFRYGALHLNGAEMTIKRFRAGNNGLFYVAFNGVPDRNAAEKIRGELSIERALLPPVDEDEFYHCDLIGLKVLVGDEVKGEVIGVSDHGAGTVLDIRDHDGRGWSAPFTKHDVPELELAAGFLRVNPETAAELIKAPKDDADEDGAIA